MHLDLMAEALHAPSHSFAWSDQDVLLGNGRSDANRHLVFSFKTTWSSFKLKWTSWKRWVPLRGGLWLGRTGGSGPPFRDLFMASCDMSMQPGEPCRRTTHWLEERSISRRKSPAML